MATLLFLPIRQPKKLLMANCIQLILIELNPNLPFCALYPLRQTRPYANSMFLGLPRFLPVHPLSDRLGLDLDLRPALGTGTGRLWLADLSAAF